MISSLNHTMFTGGAEMAYKIQYSQDTDYRYPQVSSKKKMRLGKWFILALLLASAVWIRQNGVPNFLVPGDPDITKAATATLIDELQNKVPMEEAVTAFCKTIIHGAGY